MFLTKYVLTVFKKDIMNIWLVMEIMQTIPQDEIFWKLLPTNGWNIDHHWNPSMSGTLTDSGIFLKILEPLFDISRSMPSAFVMISCNFGSAKDVTSQLHDIDGVEQVLIVSGIYDIIVRITVQNKDDLRSAPSAC